jgi:hypothetical protein
MPRANDVSAIGFAARQWLKTGRMLKKTRAERAAKEAAERDGGTEG